MIEIMNKKHAANILMGAAGRTAVAIKHFYFVFIVEPDRQLRNINLILSFVINHVSLQKIKIFRHWFKAKDPQIGAESGEKKRHRPDVSADVYHDISIFEI